MAAGRFILDEATPIQERAPIVAGLIEFGWAASNKLAQTPADSANASLADGARKLRDLQLWKADTLPWAGAAASETLSVPAESGAAEKLVGRLGRASLRSRAVTSDIKLAIGERSGSQDFANLGPCAEMRALAEAKIPHAKLDRTLRTGAQGLPLPGIRKCFGRFASSTRRYYRFPGLLHTATFPATVRAIVEWGALP